MRKTIILILVLSIATLGGVVLSKNISGTNGNKVSAVLGSLKGKQVHKATLSIEGMWCASCAVGAEYSLKALEGVADAYIGFTNNLDGEGWVVYDAAKVTKEQIVKAIEPYKATIVSDIIYNQKAKNL